MPASPEAVPAPLHDVQTLLVVLAFVVMGRFLIPPWTSTELLRFVSFVSLASGVGLFFAQVPRRPAIAWPPFAKPCRTALDECASVRVRVADATA